MMDYPIWPGFDDKTGDPRMDNDMRNLNRRLWRDTQRRFQFVGVVGRKRKKEVKRAEGSTYIKLVASVMTQLARRSAGDNERKEVG